MDHADLVALSDGTPRHVAIQAPVAEGEAVELARQTRLFRKQVLKVGKINYKGRTLEFTPDYLDGLALAHREGAFDSVPLVFAPADNSHTQDVERIRGEIVGFERTDDGLDAIVRAANDSAAALLRENPRIGCSVRIEQPLTRADGKHWPAAIQHVLATANPRVTGLRPWEPVDLAADDVPVLDLSTYDFADGSLDGGDTTEKEPTMADLTPEETAKLRELLATLADAEAAAEAQGEPDGELALPTDEQLAEIAAGLFDNDEAATPAGAALSNESSEALELANARLDAQAIELAQLRAERDAERYARLRDQLATDKGIPPAITELAKPLLLGSHTIELSNGGSVDAGEVVLKVMEALADHSRLVDLSSPTVYDTPGSAAEADDAARADEVAAYRRAFGL